MERANVNKRRASSTTRKFNRAPLKLELRLCFNMIQSLFTPCNSTCYNGGWTNSSSQHTWTNKPFFYADEIMLCIAFNAEFTRTHIIKKWLSVIKQIFKKCFLSRQLTKLSIFLKGTWGLFP